MTLQTFWKKRIKTKAADRKAAVDPRKPQMARVEKREYSFIFDPLEAERSFA